MWIYSFSFGRTGLWQLTWQHPHALGWGLDGLAARVKMGSLKPVLVKTWRMLLAKSRTFDLLLSQRVNGHRFQPTILRQIKSVWLYLCPAACISLVSANFGHPILICCRMSARALPEGGREVIFPNDCCWHLQNRSEVSRLFFQGF